MPYIGLLWDSVSNNTGDKAIGIVLQRALHAAEIPFRILDPFRPDVEDVSTVIVGGGAIIRPRNHPFYEAFRVPGKQILNTPGVAEGSQDLEYLQDYRFVSVRSQYDHQLINGIGTVAPCLSMLYKNYLPDGQPPFEIPSGAIGIHVSYAFAEEAVLLAQRLRKLNIGPIVWIPITHYVNDRALMRVLARHVPNSIVLPEMNPDDTFRAIGQLRALVSCSLHGAIFAYTQNIPFLLFKHPAKMQAFMVDRNLAAYLFGSADEITSKLPEFIENPPGFTVQLSNDTALCQDTLNAIIFHSWAALNEPLQPVHIPATSRARYNLEMSIGFLRGTLKALRCYVKLCRSGKENF